MMFDDGTGDVARQAAEGDLDSGGRGVEPPSGMGRKSMGLLSSAKESKGAG